MNFRDQPGSLQMSGRAYHAVYSLVWPTILLATFIIFDEVSIQSSDYYEIQTGLFFSLNQSLSHWPLFWSNVTELGNVFVLFPVVSYLIIRHPQAWAALFGAVPLSCLFSTAGKQFASIPRPAAILPHDQINIIGETLTSHTSFPSGHSLTSFAVVTVVVLSQLSLSNSNKRWIWASIGLFIAGVLAVSRIAVGAHWPLDTVAGGFLGIITGISGIALTQRFRSWWIWIETRSGQWVLCFLMLLWGVALVIDMLGGTKINSPILGVSAVCAVSVSVLRLIDLLFVGSPSEKQPIN